ncbi:hypothetical protein WA171_003793 [Blastocystis sp. BT1]
MSVGSDEELYEEKSRTPKRKVKPKANPKPKREKTATEIALKKEMHRRCESRRRARINQCYDHIFDLLEFTSTLQSKSNAKTDRCSLLRFTLGYMRELKRVVNDTARLLCQIAHNKQELISLFPPAQLQFILQSNFVDDDVCLMLAACYNMPYESRQTQRYSSQN